MKAGELAAYLGNWPWAEPQIGVVETVNGCRRVTYLPVSRVRVETAEDGTQAIVIEGKR